MFRTKLRRRAIAALAVALAAAVALGGAELILQDGRVLKGDSVRKDEDVYVLTTPTGELTMPVELVDGVRLTGEPEPEAPTAFKVVPPGAIVGEEIRPPTAEEQTRAIGNPSKFAPSIVDHEWHPTSALSDEDVLADSRSTWAEDIVDSEWKPTSAFDETEDVLAGSRSTWAKPAIDSSWKPTDGFAKSSD
ncbi:MAG TPA: hypothetical protein VF139_19775 [Candidatus Polarisedimenticolaceae bacterium]